jgi:hypothetical protein
MAPATTAQPPPRLAALPPLPLPLVDTSTETVLAADLAQEDAQEDAPALGGATLLKACRVPGCGMHQAEAYFNRTRLCAAHRRTDSLLFEGLDCRFCQKCNRLHPLALFKGRNRTCTTKLQHHNSRRRAAYASKKAKPAAADDDVS